MTVSSCRVCDGEGWVCEEHGSHAMNLCPSAVVLAAPCACNPLENAPADFESIEVGAALTEGSLVDSLA